MPGLVKCLQTDDVLLRRFWLTAIPNTQQYNSVTKQQYKTFCFKKITKIQQKTAVMCWYSKNKMLEEQIDIFSIKV